MLISDRLIDYRLNNRWPFSVRHNWCLNFGLRLVCHLCSIAQQSLLYATPVCIFAVLVGRPVFATCNSISGEIMIWTSKLWQPELHLWLITHRHLFEVSPCQQTAACCRAGSHQTMSKEQCWVPLTRFVPTLQWWPLFLRPAWKLPAYWITICHQPASQSSIVQLCLTNAKFRNIV